MDEITIYNHHNQPLTKWGDPASTLPETNSDFTPKNDGETNRNLRDSRGPLFSGDMLNFREGKWFDFNKPEHANISLSRIFWTSKT